MIGKNLDMVGRTDGTKESAWTSRAILGAWDDLHRNDT